MPAHMPPWRHIDAALGQGRCDSRATRRCRTLARAPTRQLPSPRDHRGVRLAQRLPPGQATTATVIDFAATLKIWRVVAAVLVIASVSGCARAPAQSISAPPCKPQAFEAAIVKMSAAAGTAVVFIRLTNTASSCRLGGWPALGLSDHGSRLPARARRVTSLLSVRYGRGRAFLLRRGKSAYLVVGYPEVNVAPRFRCMRADRLIVSFGGDDRSVGVRFSAEVCQDGLLLETPFLATVA